VDSVHLVFTIGYPNQKSKVLGSYRPLVKVSLFHERFKFLSAGGRQLGGTSLSTGPHLMDKLLCYLRMVRVPQLFTWLHWAGVALAEIPRVWPLLSSGPHICLVTSSYIGVLILSGLWKVLLTPTKQRKTCTNSTLGVNTSSRGMLSTDKRCSKPPKYARMACYWPCRPVYWLWDILSVGIISMHLQVESQTYCNRWAVDPVSGPETSH